MKQNMFKGLKVTATVLLLGMVSSFAAGPLDGTWIAENGDNVIFKSGKYTLKVSIEQPTRAPTLEVSAEGKFVVKGDTVTITATKVSQAGFQYCTWQASNTKKLYTADQAKTAMKKDELDWNDGCKADWEPVVKTYKLEDKKSLTLCGKTSDGREYCENYQKK